MFVYLFSFLIALIKNTFFFQWCQVIKHFLKVAYNPMRADGFSPSFPLPLFKTQNQGSWILKLTKCQDVDFLSTQFSLKSVAYISFIIYMYIKAHFNEKKGCFFMRNQIPLKLNGSSEHIDVIKYTLKCTEY